MEKVKKLLPGCALALVIETGYGRRCMYPICLKHDEYDH